MSIFQNADRVMNLGFVISCIAIVAIVIERRRVSLLKREMQQLSADVKGLVAAEQKRYIELLKMTANKTKRPSASRE
jgi:hypothetical protein